MAFIVSGTALGQAHMSKSTPVVLADDQSTIPVSLQALNYPSSAGNSSVAQLGPGASFTGQIDNILNLQATQISIACDQPYTLVIRQYVDAAGLFVVSTDTFTRLANVPYNENVTLPGNYFNITVVNNGAGSTTSLDISTTYGIMATGPRTVTNLGNNRTALNEVGGSAFNLGQSTKAGSIPVALASDQVLPVSGTLTVAAQGSAGSVPLTLDSLNQLLISSLTPLQVRETADGYTSSESSHFLLREGDREQYPLREQLVYDTNLEKVLGTQNLVQNQRLNTYAANAPETILQATLTNINQEAVFPLTGMGTVTLSITGTGGGFLVFYGSVDGLNYQQLYGEPISGVAAGTAAQVVQTTAGGIWRFRVAGLLYFRVYASTAPSGVYRLTVVESSVPFTFAPTTVTVVGTGNILQQKGSTNELYTYDTYALVSTGPSTGLLQNALTNADPWNSKGVYYIGDVATYNGQVYQCILNTAAVFPLPTNVSYWQVDQRQNKSLVSNSRVSTMNAARLRVEQEDSQYVQRMQESLLIYTQLKTQNELLFQDYFLDAVSLSGKKYSLGQSSGEMYYFEEFR